MKKEYHYEELVALIEKHDFEPVKNWLRNGGDPNLGISEGETALTLQVLYELFEEGDTEEVISLIRVFLDQGATTDPVSAIKPGELLFEALASGNRDAVKLLLEHGANCNVIDESDYPRQTPLIAAVEKNDSELVRLLLPFTSPELLQFVGGYLVATALGSAFGNSNEAIIQLLLEAGANPYFPEWDHGNAYSMCIRPPEGSSAEQEIRLNNLVEKFSKHSKKEGSV
ncbi:MAG: ankyrin repeat domain-containing protein [Fluviicola sp.]